MSVVPEVLVSRHEWNTRGLELYLRAQQVQ